MVMERRADRREDRMHLRFLGWMDHPLPAQIADILNHFLNRGLGRRWKLVVLRMLLVG